MSTCRLSALYDFLLSSGCALTDTPHRRSLLQSSSRRLPIPAKLSPAKYTNKMVTTSKTLKSTILEIAIL